MGLAERTLADTVDSVRHGRLAVTDVVDELIARIQSSNGDDHLFIQPDLDALREQAILLEERMAAGDTSGDLLGVPIAIKDNIAVAGQPLSAGSLFLRDSIAARDAPMVARLRAEGAVIIARANMHEFALGGTSANPHYGDVANPAAPGMSPLGSSGGSASAVAAGVAVASLGTDTSGSVRMPAAATGTVGLKPTTGLLSTDGLITLSGTLDAIGPMSRTVHDSRLLFRVLSGRAPVGAGGVAPRRLPLTVLAPRRELLEPATEAVLRAFDRALEVLGSSYPLRRVDGSWIGDSVAIAGTILAFEAAAYHRGWLADAPENYGDDVRAALMAGALIAPADYEAALGRRSALLREALEYLPPASVLILPTLPYSQIPQGQDLVALGAGALADRIEASLRFVSAASLTGFPAMSVPFSSDENGHPVGIQIVGRPGEEEWVFEAALILEGANAPSIPLREREE